MEQAGFKATLLWNPITIVLLVFVFLMLLTGTTLLSLFKAVSTPVKAIKEQAETAYQTKLEKEEENQKDEKQLKVIKGFNVDIPVDDIPEKRDIEDKTLDDKQRKLISTYYDKENDSDDSKTTDEVAAAKKVEKDLVETAEEQKNENDVTCKT